MFIKDWIKQGKYESFGFISRAGGNFEITLNKYILNDMKVVSHSPGSDASSGTRILKNLYFQRIGP